MCFHGYFAFFDTGYRVLNGEHPFKDFWVVSGPFIDYTQAIIFYIFGVSWKSYLINSSLLNSLVVVTSFILFKKLGANDYLNLFFCLCISILAYPNSGTPFVDHHSAYLSLIGIYLFCFSILKNRMSYWFLIPIVISFSFFSKQIPASFIAIALIFSLFIIFYLIKRIVKKFFDCNFFNFLCVLFYLFTLKIFNIDFSLFQTIFFISFNYW